MTPRADMRAAAVVSGRSHERFRKIWPSLVRREAFPAPFSGPPYYWDPARLEAWRADRAEARRQALMTAPVFTGANDDDPHHDAPPSPIRKGRVAAGRSRLMQRMGSHL